MLKISSVAKITNGGVLIKAEEKPTVANILKRRQDEWIGHLLQCEGFLKTITEGEIEGQNCRGKLRKEYV